MAFHNVVFPEDYSQGVTGGPEFKTTVIVAGSGYEQRNVDWAYARGRWDLSRLLYDTTTRDATIAFFRARKGRAHSFLFKDWADYFAGMTWNPTTKVLDHSGPHNFAVGTLGVTTFQILKIYTDGGASDNRKITRPKSAIKVYVNNVEVVSGFTVNYSTGVITFSVAPTAGHAIGWSGEFYVPVRFDTDLLNLDYMSPTVADAPLPVVEVRE